MMAITKGSLKSILRNPSSVIFSLVFPMIFIVVFGFLGSGHSAFDVAITKNSNRDNPIFQKLVQVSNFRISDGELDEIINTRLEKGELDAVLDIKKNPDGVMPQYIVEVKTNKATPEKSNLCKLILVHVIDKVNIKELKPEASLVEIKETEVQGRLFKLWSLKDFSPHR